ncbi:preprotein translocase subunit SecG [Myxococcota bacterium]|nr:preprotein translocase subunit SecG [Myxococcota bacterium]
MQLFVTILHIFLCLALILIILLQPGKEGAAAFGGGGANQMYGPRGQAHFLGRATTVVAALFMFTSITLALYSSTRVASDSDLEEGIQELPAGEEEEGFQLDRPAPATPEPSPTGAIAPSPEAGDPASSAPADPAVAPLPSEGSAIEELGAPDAPAQAPAP